MPTLFIYVAVLFCSSMSFAVEKLAVKGDVYNLSGSKKLYDYKRFVDFGESSITMRNEYKDLKGEVAVLEKAQLKKDGKLKVYSVDHKQTKESGTILVKDNKVLFSYTNAAGKKSTSVETFNKDFVVGMTLIPYIKDRWQKILKGEILKTRFGVWDRRETIGFNLSKESEKTVNGQKQITVVMAPTNFIIRRLLDPIRFTFNAKNKDLLFLKGRTQPKIKKGTGWGDLDALIKYTTLLHKKPATT